MKKITEIRCSQLARPMTCAGYLFFENLPIQPTNDAAKEGTAFGEYVAQLLTHQSTKTHATNGVPIDDDMKFYAKDLIQNIFDSTGGVDKHSEILCETRIDWRTRSGIWIKGSYDISYVKDDKLYIDDVKYGWGIVDVKENWQLLAYAIGEVLRRGKAFDRIVLRILQPRPHHEDGPIRAWEITYDQLLEYKEQIEDRMMKISQGFAELVTSSKCKYCPAAGSACTAFNRAVYHGIDYVLSDFKQDHLNEKEIAHQLELLERVTEVLKIKSDSIKELAVSKMSEGAIIPGFMIEQNYGDRKWKKEISPEVIKVLTGIDIVEKVMLSPAKAEKIGVPKDLVKNYVDRHFIGVKLVKKDASKIANKIFNNKGVNNV